VAVNELSCTIDLDSTLIRAEALFKRFQRLVDAVDKKGNFPAPRPRLSQPSESGSSADSAASPAQGGGRDNGKAPAQSPQQKQPEKVITPELRRLLSKQVEVLSHQEPGKKADASAVARGK
jgi:hypothetical protein